MNSKVKHELRDGASVSDISAGLCYSVIKNCLYKVLKLKNVGELGHHLVVQGGTMRNDGVVRALELETGAQVKRYDKPELMGAFGCAIYAMSHATQTLTLNDIITKAEAKERTFHCKGCDNQCLIVDYKFENGKRYYSGNKCEKIYSNDERIKRNKLNSSTWKYKLLFERNCEVPQPAMRIGIPRILNMYEEYPFWHALFHNCGIEVCLSDSSTFKAYEENVRMVMSDNICFPAKLVHSHIQNLIERKVHRIFMPFVVHEQNHGHQNSYNCPIVTGYSEVIKSVQSEGTIIDAPTISFKDNKLLFKQCQELLTSYGIMPEVIEKAFKEALSAYDLFVKQLIDNNREILEQAESNGELVIMLGCRPYHVDPVIQHKVSDMLSDMGVHVITDDYVRDKNIDLSDVHYLAQWFTTNKIIKGAKWCATQGNNVQYVQLTSFGCGPDAFLNDEIRHLLLRHHKSHTILKLDDINNLGSMKLRVRSMIESLKLANEHDQIQKEVEAFETVPVYNQDYRDRKILAPFFTPFISPIIPALLKIAGYEAENLPMSDRESSEWGLKYANNEICYPATLIVGDVIKAFKSGAQDPAKCAIGITQTGGQCRASNYISLIKKGLIEAGYKDVPVISFTLGSGINNNQPAFHLNWFKLIPYVLRGILFTDCIAKFYHASIARENRVGASEELTNKYLSLAAIAIEKKNFTALNRLLAEAVADFNAICLEKQTHKVGIVGEIYLKFNPHAQQHVTEWLIAKNIEVMPPVMLDFFTQSFVNHKIKVENYVLESSFSDTLMGFAYKIIRQQVKKTEQIAKGFN